MSVQYKSKKSTTKLLLFFVFNNSIFFYIAIDRTTKPVIYFNCKLLFFWLIYCIIAICFDENACYFSLQTERVPFPVTVNDDVIFRVYNPHTHPLVVNLHSLVRWHFPIYYAIGSVRLVVITQHHLPFSAAGMRRTICQPKGITATSLLGSVSCLCALTAGYCRRLEIWTDNIPPLWQTSFR